MAVINDGPEAFATRVTLARCSRHSLDFQCFQWDGDRCGSYLLTELLAAADEGVRVRLLIDDFSRLNRRMHNKLFIADNQLGVVGGRNIADSCFGFDPHRNFRDRDLLVAGGIVREISNSLDPYRNRHWAVPVRAFAWQGTSQHRLAELRWEFSELLRKQTDPRLAKLDNRAVLADTLARTTGRMRRAPVTVVADTPDKLKEPSTSSPARRNSTPRSGCWSTRPKSPARSPRSSGTA